MKKRFLPVLLPVVLLLPGGLFAQTAYTVQAEGSKVAVEGTSSLHSWTAAVNSFEGSAAFPGGFGQKTGESPGKVTLKFTVKSMDGGRGEAMNKKIMNALKQDSHPFIEFVSEGPLEVTASSQGFEVLAKGKLAMAGETREAGISLSAQPIDDGKFRFQGKHSMKMSAFNIEPPSAMFGQIVTGDEITVVFDLVFVSASQP